MISELEKDKVVQKLGKAPLEYYPLIQIESEKETTIISYEKEQFLNQHFLLIDPLGNCLEGLKAMNYWCEKQQLQLTKTIDEYV